METSRTRSLKRVAFRWRSVGSGETSLSRFSEFFTSAMSENRYSLAPTVAAASVLVLFSTVTSFAQIPALGGSESEGHSGFNDYEGASQPEPFLGSPDLPPVAQTADAPASQDKDKDQGGTADPPPPVISQWKVNVNPVTGMVSSNGTYTPLTGAQRWQIYWKMNFFSVGAYFGPFFSALVLDQATGSPAQWGGGFRGYGKRVGVRTVSAMLQGTFQAPVAYALHEDVRYIMSDQPGIKRRIAHAVLYSFLTYNSSGHPTLNIGNLGAYYASTAVSTTWLPGHYKVLSYTLSNASEQIVLSLPVNILQEFWPDMMRVIHRH
jgi:hypothetical protein